MTDRILARTLAAAALAALLAALGAVSAPVHGQSSRSQAPPDLTGDPLVDSILQAPGPDFLREDERRVRQPDDTRRYDDRGRDREAPRRTDDPPRREAPARRARRDPPPPPARRSGAPTDTMTADADERADRAEETGRPEDNAARAASPGTSPPGSREAAAAVPPPETAPREASEDAAPPEDDAASEAEEPYREPRRRRGEPAPPVPAEAPDRRRVAAAPAERPARPATSPAPEPEKPSKPEPELGQMLGQMLIIGFTGTSPSDPGVKRAAQQVRTGEAGGVIFMSRNITGPAQVKRLTAAFSKAGQDRPTPFIAVDQEGGYVQRLSRAKGFKTHPSAERLGQRNDPEGAFSAYRALAEELRTYGFNLNLGPVVDLNLNAANPVIGRLKRSYGSEPEHVTAFAKAFILAHHQTGVLTAAKHFPGHGSSNTDSHDELVDVSRTWTEEELEPYRRLIAGPGVDMIMVGHLYHPRFSEDDRTPASLSPKAITDMLRKKLGYDGVVVTDDLDMRGVRETTTFDERIVEAVVAGNDILLIANSNGYRPNLPERAAKAIRAAIEAGRITRVRVRRSYDRVIALKDRLARLQRTAGRR